MKLFRTLTAAFISATALLSAGNYLFDFEEANPKHVTESPFEGKQCFRMPGVGKYSYTQFPVTLKTNASYHFSVQLRKVNCTAEDAKMIDLGLISYDANKKQNNILITGRQIPADGQWHEITKDFVTGDSIQRTVLMLYNRLNGTVDIDAVVLECTGETPAVQAAPKAEEKSTLVSRPLPPDFDDTKEDWLVNRRGIEALDPDFILPPFTPIEIKGTAASVWGRTYNVGANGLLQGVNIQGAPFLAKGMSFNATVNGKKVTFKAGKTIALREHKGLVEYLTRCESAEKDIAAEVRTTIEYDGMVKIDLTLIPRGCVALSHFDYSFDLNTKDAKFMHYTGPREGGLSLNVQKSSYTRAIPEGNGTVWKSPFKLLVWLGNETKGFLWFCESEKEWMPQDRKGRMDGLKVVKDNGTTSLVVTPVHSEFLIARPITWTFGLMATPFRPKPSGWRNNYVEYANTIRSAEAKVPGLKFASCYSSGTYEILPPETKNDNTVSFYPRIYNKDLYKERIRRCHARGVRFGLYIDPILCSMGVYKDMSLYKTVEWNPVTDNAEDPSSSGNVSNAGDFLWQPPEVKRFFGEWHKEKISTAPYSRHRGERQFQPGLGSRYADFFCYLMEQHAKCGADGIANLDEWGPTSDMNLLHDAGYMGRDGKVYPEYDWFARRNLVKRMCAVFLKETGKMPLMQVHSAATMVAPSASFCEACYTGELYNSGYWRASSLYDEYAINKDKILESLKPENKGRDFLYYVAPPERWVVECGTPFGWYGQLFSQFWKSPGLEEYGHTDTATREFLAMCLAHDNVIQAIFCNPQPVWNVIAIKQAFGIGDDSVEYFPYYGDEHFAQTDTKEIYIVSYRNKGKNMMIVCNLGLNDADCQLKLNTKYCKGVANMTNAESKEAIPVANNTLKLQIPRRDFRILTF